MLPSHFIARKIGSSMISCPRKTELECKPLSNSYIPPHCAVLAASLIADVTALHEWLQVLGYSFYLMMKLCLFNDETQNGL